MEIKKSLQSIKHLFRSPNCINCTQPLDDIIFNVDEGKVLCPICSFKHDPTELYSDREIINLSEILIPDVYDKFLSKVGFQRKSKRRTSKIALVFLIIVMVIGTMVSAATMEINVVLKILVGVLFVAAVIWQILRYYKEEEKPKWYREKITRHLS